MHVNPPNIQKPSIAVIGSGISGLSVAYSLHQAGHSVTVFEKEARIGGHSRTIDVPDGFNNHIAVDTGFIVFNRKNYPNLCALFEYLGVQTEKSDMSFGVDIKNTGATPPRLQYSSDTVFTRPENLISKTYWRMLFDIARFNITAQRILKRDDHRSLAQFLKDFNGGRWFEDYFLRAMGAAIWSTPHGTIGDFPAKSFIRFFKNHGLLRFFGQPQWYTVTGGSRQYVEKLTASFKNHIHTNCAVTNVRFDKNLQKVIVSTANDEKTFGRVVFACHADTARTLYQNPTNEQAAVLNAFETTANHIIVHTDDSFMSADKSVWASWVYLKDEEKPQALETKPALTYWMNNLQNLKTARPLFITLNPHRAPENILDETSLRHPLFTRAAIEAQDKIPAIQGQNRIWFCGAWQRYGFHEDGIWSARRVLDDMKVYIPWA